MKFKYTVAMVILLMIGPVTANAVSVQSTNSTYISFRQCISGTTVCDSIGASQFVSVAGLPGSPKAQARHEDPAYGMAVGNAERTGDPGAAKLKAGVKSMPAMRNGSTNLSLQLYTNTSERPQLLSYEGTLTYDQTVPDENADFPADGGGRSAAFAEVELSTMNTTTIEVGTTAEENFAALSEGPPSDSDYQTLKSFNTHGLITGVTEKGTKEFSMAVELEPGKSIWVFALLQGIAANGAEVNASLETKLKITTE